MPFKKINVSEHQKCPECGGATGLKYYRKVDTAFGIPWGSDTISKQLNTHFKKQLPKTARCADCGKRVELLTGDQE
jgi:DNA-directed RNA polymerase subunit RPC12/RpoP